MTDTATTSSKKALATKDELEYEFIRSGERDRLQEIMVKRLKECGWVRQVEELCKREVERKGVDRITVEELLGEVKNEARRLVADDVKKELMEHIQQFVRNNTEPYDDEK